MKKLLGIFVITIALMPFIASGDDVFFEDEAIVDSVDADITTEPVTLDLDSGVANVASFDIAGIMLGMPFEDVQTLFFKTKGLYTPREKNSIIYTIHPDWKSNLYTG